MQFICEIVPSTYLTPLRRILANELDTRGYKQAEIADILGVSQPVVSNYLRTPISDESELTSKPAFKKLITTLTDHIINKIISPMEIMEIVCQECQKFRIGGPLCEIHRKRSKVNFPIDCNLCFPSTALSTVFNQKLQILKELYEAAQKLIETEELFGHLIPEIGSQFIYILENSSSPDDIIGFPGRIVNVKGRGKIVSPPEFSQGAILAQILIYFINHDSPHRSLISLKNTDEILKTISSEKRVITTAEADNNWNITLQHISKDQISQIDAIADSGGVGFEPIIYFFGHNPHEIVSFLTSKF